MSPPLDYSFLSEEEKDQDNELDYSFLSEEEKPEKGFLESAADTFINAASDASITAQKYAKGLYEGIPAAFENRREIANKINASLGSAQVGIASALGQIGKNENEFYGYDGPDALTDALNSYVEGNKGKATARLDKAIKLLETAKSKQKLTPEGEFVRDATTMGSESVGSMLVGGAAKSALTGIAAMGPQVFGQSYEQLKKEGEGEAGAVLHGAAKTVIELASELLPMQKVLNLPDGVARKIADMTLIEGSTEAASSAAEDVYDAFVRDKNFDIDKSIRKATESFKLGAVSGAVIGGAVATPQIAGNLASKSAEVIKDFAAKQKSASPDQSGQPNELFNPTHKANGGVDVQVATKNGKIIPDTYITAQGETIRDANAVANNPNESIDVTLDVSAVAEKIKAEISGDVETPVDIIPDLNLEQSNQDIIDQAFAAPPVEPINQGIINSQIIEKTPDQLRQQQINDLTPQNLVSGQQGLPAEIPVTQPEINQKKIDSLAVSNLTEEPTKVPSEDALIGEAFGSRMRREEAHIENKEAINQENRKKARVGRKKELTARQKEIAHETAMLAKENDTVEKMLAKAGGLNRESMARDGVDPENFKSKAKVFGKPLFPKNGGMTADDVAEKLNEQGFRGGNLTANEALDIVFESLDNNSLFANEETAAAKSSLDNESDSIAQELEAIDALEAQPKRLEPRGKKVDEVVVGKPVIDESGNKELTKAIDAESNQAATSPTNNTDEPTEAQKQAGNYKKGTLDSKTIPWLKGLDIAIENPAGSKRQPSWPALKNHYGYFKRSEAFDGDEVDVFIGPDMESQPKTVFVIDQVDPKTGKPDEHKVILGVNSAEEAKATYLDNYEKGWQGIGDIKEYEFDDFKSKVQSGFFKNSTPSRKMFSKQEALKKSDRDNVSRETKPNAVKEDAVVNYSKETGIITGKFVDNNSGTVFEHKKPVKFEYTHNTESSPNMGETFGQHIEPAGRYLNTKSPSAVASENIETGTVKFNSPLVIAWNTKEDGGYDDTGWKAKLSKKYNGLTGKKLSQAIVNDGYDGIVTAEVNKTRGKSYVSEIVDLTGFKKDGKTKQSVSEKQDPYKVMTGKEISYEVEVEETGETYTVTVDAGTVMKDLDTRLDALQKLRECI